jgi:hydrogenase maturation protease
VKTVVACVGNSYRGDDAVGIVVAERLRGQAGAIEVVLCEQEPSRLLDAWDGANVALVVDAVVSGSAPGTIHRFDASEDPLPDGVFRGSTHAFGVGEVIEVARALGRLPGRVLVYGVEGSRFGAGEEMSADVSAAADALVVELIEEARCTTAP